VRTAAQEWQLAHGRWNDCPTYGTLLDERRLDPSIEELCPRNSIRITCAQGDVIVSWSGRDGVFGTPDVP
jgi:hypothetical protein